MREKMFPAIIMITALAMLCGCGSGASAGRTGSSSAGVKDVLEAGVKQAQQDEASEEELSSENAVDSLWEAVPADEAADTAAERQSGVSENAPVPEASAADTAAVLSTTEGIDVDLTIMSSTMVYSQVFSMLSMPEEFIGQTVRMKGEYAPLYDEVTGNHYDACIVKDATACCASGIEFVLTDDYVYPDSYPAEGEEILVTGTFDTYYEDEYMYCTLRDAKLGE